MSYYRMPADLLEKCVICKGPLQAVCVSFHSVGCCLSFSMVSLCFCLVCLLFLGGDKLRAVWISLLC